MSENKYYYFHVQLVANESYWMLKTDKDHNNLIYQAEQYRDQSFIEWELHTKLK